MLCPYARHVNSPDYWLIPRDPWLTEKIDDWEVKPQYHYENMPMQYTEIFKVVKNENFQWKYFDIFLIFAPKHRLWVHVRTASAKIRKIGIPLYSPCLLYKSGV